jgi:predicted branched-subunit amino acid permease
MHHFATRMPMSSAADPSPIAKTSPFMAGVRTAFTSVFALVLVGTYVGIGALAHSYGFSLVWVAMGTLLVWAGPAQVILLTALGSGASPLDAAIAVGLSGIRLMPMVVVLMPLLKQPATRARELILPAHLTAASMWVESLSILPRLPREQRIAFSNGLGSAFLVIAEIGGAAGFLLAASLPHLLTAGLLFLTPMSFLLSTAGNSRLLTDRLALALGLLIGALFAASGTELDLMWTGIVGGSVAYGVHRLRGWLR